MYEIDDFAEFIHYAGVASIGDKLFIYSAPAEVAECIILKPSYDPPVVDAERPGYIQGQFQTIVRANRYQDGLDLCKQLDACLTFNNRETTTIVIKECRPLYQPRVYRRGEGGELEMSITYKVTYVVK